MASARDHVIRVLQNAGITVGGTAPYDIDVRDEDFYNRVFVQGSLGLGESYMDGWWNARQLDAFFCRLLESGVINSVSLRRSLAPYLRALLTNEGRRGRAFQIGETHYDIGNDLFGRMLDPYMQYSCAYWKDAHLLREAQVAKMRLICNKLQLQKGMRVLDIGCGWGGLARFAAENYGVSVDGYTVSKEQVVYAEEKSSHLPVKYFLQDYRSIEGTYDRIMSVGMFEHVGSKNYKIFFDVTRRSLHNDGLLLLHTIGTNASTRATDPWIKKYIFNNGILPSPQQITRGFEKLFVIEDWHNFGAHYDTTLMAWHENFKNAWPDLFKSGKYTKRFYRMWEYYLLCCAGSFRARQIQLWQLVLSPRGVKGGYESIR